MNKASSNSLLRALPPEQQEQLKRWFLKTNASATEVARRCAREFGVTVHPSSVKRYYHRHLLEWKAEPPPAACPPNAREPDPVANERKYQQLLERILELAVDTARLSSAPADLRVVADYARVLIAARRESHEALRAGTAREKFEFDAATACLIHQTKVQAIAGDDQLNDEQRILRIRQELFGASLAE